MCSSNMYASNTKRARWTGPACKQHYRPRRGCHDDLYRKAVLCSIAQLAAKFNAQVVAEGVEDAEDLEAVAEAGIGLTQGYYFSKPLTVEEFLASDWAHFSPAPMQPASQISLPAVS